MRSLPMPQIDNFFYGLLLGALTFAVAYGLLYLVNTIIIMIYELPRLLSQQLMITIALAAELLPFHYYDNRKAGNTLRGIMMFVFVVAMFMLYYFFWPLN